VTIQPGSVITGDVIYNGELDNKGEIIGDEITDPIAGWPTSEQLIWFYEWDVKDLIPPDSPYPDDPVIGPLKRNGDLDILSSVNDVEATLNGTVYVTGDLRIGSTNKDFIINLNGHTIFVESDSDVAIDIGGRCTFIGSGCIIAVGGIKCYPKIASEEDDFVLIMSLEGSIDFQPQGDFYGAVIGDTDVTLQPGNSLTWVDPYEIEGGLNFPWDGYVGPKYLATMRTWEINPT